MPENNEGNNDNDDEDYGVEQTKGIYADPDLVTKTKKKKDKKRPSENILADQNHQNDIQMHAIQENNAGAQNKNDGDSDEDYGVEQTIGTKTADQKEKAAKSKKKKAKKEAKETVPEESNDLIMNDGNQDSNGQRGTISTNIAALEDDDYGVEQTIGVQKQVADDDLDLNQKSSKSKAKQAKKQQKAKVEDVQEQNNNEQTIVALSSNGASAAAMVNEGNQESDDDYGVEMKEGPAE